MRAGGCAWPRELGTTPSAPTGSLGPAHSDGKSLISVVDVFAGPGGLNEGFSQVGRDSGAPTFSVVASFEKDPTAVATLKLRSAVRAVGIDNPAYRRLLEGGALQDLRSDPAMAVALAQASAEVHEIELGESHRAEVRRRISRSLNGAQDWVLIGGPPCQAYSLVGRSRRAHDETFAADEKHFLYREYLDIIQDHKPAVFVMENVKGLLSASHAGIQMFGLIRKDLEVGGEYEIRSLVVESENPDPSDFIIRAEDYGIPQRRHRVILLGVRQDFADRVGTPLAPTGPVTVRSAIGDMSPVVAHMSRSVDDLRSPADARLAGVTYASEWLANRRKLSDARVSPDKDAADRLRRWLRVGDVPITLHEPRRHMALDLARYVFLEELAREGYAPKVDELPAGLAPDHKNVSGNQTPFRDRFKVQEWDRPSSTVASHISKDGHYYIHPDPAQMRSLTVREAARLQTFPDDYFFCGTRTMQYHQVGNAVPPLLAYQIAKKVANILGVG